MATINKTGSTPRTTSTAAATRTAAAPSKKRTLKDLAAETAAPTAGGKIPGGAKTAKAGATVRAQGRGTIDLDAFKQELRSGVIDGQSLANYRQQRQESFDARKTATQTSFASIQAAVAEGAQLRQVVADNLQEIADLMPKEMLSKTNIQTTEDAKKKKGFFDGLIRWVTRKPAPEKLNELDLANLLLKQIDLCEAAAGTLEEKTKGLEGVEQHLAASRVEFSGLCEKSITDLNSTVEVLVEVNNEIEGIKAELATLDELSTDYGKLEGELRTKGDQARELTRLAAFLKDSIQNYRDFEAMGEQLAELLTNVKANADRVLGTAFKMIETQSVTTGVIAQVAQVIDAADWTMLVFDTTNQNNARAVEYISGRVGNFAENMEEWMSRSHDAHVQMTAAMMTANIKTEQDLDKFKKALIADFEAGKREVMIPTTAKAGPRTSNPLRAKSSALGAYIDKAKQERAGRAGIKLS